MLFTSLWKWKIHPKPVLYLSSSVIFFSTIHTPLEEKKHWSLQALRAKQLYSETELQNLALQVMSMLRSDGSGDAQALVS